MRIFLLPISTRRALIYCQRVNKKPTADLSYLDRATKKAADTWSKWEAAKGGWQKKLTEYGNRGMQRIPYQEWGLKSFPPANAQIEAEELAANKKFPVHYPGNIMKYEDVSKVMARLAKERKQLHWNRFTCSLIGLPFSLPFGLIPVLPNIPFFYLAFRSWSHWRALKGSDHLDFIIDNRLFQPTPTPELESVYRKTVPNLPNSFTYVTKSQVEEGIDPDEKLLLTSSSHTLIAKNLGVPELGGEVERAVRQVETSLKREDEERQAKENLEAARQEAEQKGKQ